MADLPPIVVLALGAAAVGGSQALALLRDGAGRNPAADVVLILAVTALVLGTLLQARFIRVAAVAPLDPGTARLARVTLAVALAVLLFVAACLLAVPAGLGGAASSGSS